MMQHREVRGKDDPVAGYSFHHPGYLLERFGALEIDESLNAPYLNTPTGLLY